MKSGHPNYVLPCDTFKSFTSLDSNTSLIWTTKTSDGGHTLRRDKISEGWRYMQILICTSEQMFSSVGSAIASENRSSKTSLIVTGDTNIEHVTFPFILSYHCSHLVKASCVEVLFSVFTPNVSFWPIFFRCITTIYWSMILFYQWVSELVPWRWNYY